MASAALNPAAKPAGKPLPAWAQSVKTTLTSGFQWVDKRVPHIRGRPALSELVGNLKPGITVSLVSLPLSISLALAADATPVQGVITAAWAGLTSSLFGGSHYNVVGPTGACFCGDRRRCV
jgi:MFS superfamily sulfate permease-like transporter